VITEIDLRAEPLCRSHAPPQTLPQNLATLKPTASPLSGQHELRVRIPVGKSSESVQCAITGLCLRMRHRPSA